MAAIFQIFYSLNILCLVARRRLLCRIYLLLSLDQCTDIYYVYSRDRIFNKFRVKCFSCISQFYIVYVFRVLI